MNYLAHAVLSFGDPSILTGNMISDFVKGKKKFDYAPKIRHGITLHRLIDSFTDSHPATAAASAVFRPTYRLYSGAFTDIVYDHFLALNNEEFLPDGLESFSLNVYKALESNRDAFPPAFAAMFPYMKEHNWLWNYRHAQGIERSFAGLVRRALYMSDSQPAAELFHRHYQLLEQCYRQFWKDVKEYARAQLIDLIQMDRPRP